MKCCANSSIDKIKSILNEKLQYNEISKIELMEIELIDGLPKGSLRFEAYEKELFSHLNIEMKWRSALYDRSNFM